MAYTPSDGNISAYYGPYLHKTNFSGSDTGAKSPYSNGFGAVILGDVSERGSLEIGFFYLNKIYFRDVNLRFIAEQTELAHITMGYRRWFNNIFSGSLTFFSAYSMGNPHIVHSDFIVGSEIDTSAHDTTEYGFDFSLLTELWSNPTWALVLDTRYSLSVTNKLGESADHYGALLGLRYQLQNKTSGDNLKKSALGR